MEKKEMVLKVIAVLESEVEKAEKTLATIQQAAIDAPGAMQSHSDTTKFQMGGLAEELNTSILGKKRAIESLASLLRSGMMENPSIVLGGTVVEVEDSTQRRSFYFVLPEAGGVEVDDEDQVIMVVTHRAPLARVLLGKAIGTVVDFPTPGNPRDIKKLRIMGIR